ncbi:hypothetical protein ACFSL4_32585 [Streptomyces caeni]|uniref:Uncharacterized protein n=1 Tax=Streptomyces caeni TaxID=2307231 RepID=A0ABW4IZH6_9ACTN
MGLGGCIILIAAGAILAFATDWHMNGVNLHLVGVIFMVVGLIGAAISSSVHCRRWVVVPPTPVIDEERHHHRDGCGDGYGI